MSRLRLIEIARTPEHQYRLAIDPWMDLSTFVGKLLEEQDGDLLREGVRVLAQALMDRPEP